MNGAESLVKTLLAGGVDVCFANPGTSEMHFVAALDQHPEMRCILGLHETVVTGAADGYARMADKPAATLLHLGPGLGNGLANIHNARRARSPMINVVGEHKTEHLAYNAPLTTDIEGIAWPVSDWVRTIASADTVGRDTADAIRVAQAAPGQISTLILPADIAWTESMGPAPAPAIPDAPTASGKAVDRIAALLKSGEPVALMIGDKALRQEGLDFAGRIAAKTGAVLFAPLSNKRVARGAGRVPVNRVPYVVEQAQAMLSAYKHLVLVGAKEPVAFFGYPNTPSRLVPDDCQVHLLAEAHYDLVGTLEALADAVGARGAAPVVNEVNRPALPTGAIDQDKIAVMLTAMLPENAVVTDESITTGRQFFPMTNAAPEHDWLQITGGAIGIGPPLAAGAAIGAPGRKVVSLQADGAGLYSAQALWTQAREGLDVTTLVFANHSYAILQGEMRKVGVQNPGRNAIDMLSLDRPKIDWVGLANSYGVQASRATSMEELCDQFGRGLAEPGPYLVEVSM